MSNLLSARELVRRTDFNSHELQELVRTGKLTPHYPNGRLHLDVNQFTAVTGVAVPEKVKVASDGRRRYANGVRIADAPVRRRPSPRLEARLADLEKRVTNLEKELSRCPR